ncbi:hypothetical protein [Pseudovibrio sp. Ad37]|uniref:hypothetical protein n=1 Tax=Pseudovibrio sp. Ad37 TaxID=989422 RepID=UPI0007B1BD26|nr:hypothetical protein [Pseudovibrio sp. Ad37]KZL26269.1 hypothetical protein PsAD37_01948 [Pseudovibrio sp. Ad37]
MNYPYMPEEPEYPINPWLLAFIVFVIAMIVLNVFFGVPATCRDGWNSPSIGSRGACSHHGGVVSHNGWIFWTSIAFSISTVVAMGKVVRHRYSAREFKRTNISMMNIAVPDGYDAEEYRKLRETGFSDEETQEIIARRFQSPSPKKNNQ